MLIPLLLMAAAAAAAPKPAPAWQAAPSPSSEASNAANAQAWEIGPIIRSRNYSVGMPLHPAQDRQGWSFEIPSPSLGAGHVHYVTFNHGPLTGKRRIVMRYRIDAAPGVRFVPREYPDEPALLSLYFQRRGDNWAARGRSMHYRWYAAPQRVVQVTPGEHVISIDLDEADWISLAFEPGTANPLAFRDAIDNAERVGFVFGAALGRGHGMFATGRARMTVTSFQIL